MTPHQTRAMLERDDVILEALHAAEPPAPRQSDPAVGTMDLGAYQVPTFLFGDLIRDLQIG